MPESAATGNAGFDDDVQVSEHKGARSAAERFADEPSRPAFKPGMSPATVREITDRVQAAAPIVLTELARVIRMRAGTPEVSPTQLSAAAAYIFIAYPDRPQALDQWLEEAGIFLFTDEIADLEVAAGGRTIGKRELRDIFAVTDAEAETLGLVQLVSEQRRSALRRAAEKPEALPADDAASEAEKPWVAEGISRSNWYYRRDTAAAKAVRAAKVSAGLTYPGVDACGVSLATWKRQRARERAAGTGEPKVRIPGDPTGEIESSGHPGQGNPSFFLTYYGRVAQNPKNRLTAPARPTYPAVHALPTAAARRYAKIALDQGRIWSGQHIDPAHPYEWFEVPASFEPTAEQEAAFVAASNAATLAHRAAVAKKAAKEKLEEERKVLIRKKTGYRPPPPMAAAENKGDLKPARVSQRVWDQVPAELRVWVRHHIGREFVRLASADAAVTHSIEPARRSIVMADALLAAYPTLTVAEMREQVLLHWQHPTAEGVALAVAALRAKRAQPRGWLADPVTVAAIRRAISAAEPAIPANRRGIVEAAAVAMLCRQKAFSTAEDAVGMFARFTTEQWSLQVSNAYYREHLRDHPEHDPCAGTDFRHVRENEERRWAAILSAQEAARTEEEDDGAEMVIPMTKAERRAHEAAEYKAACLAIIEAELAAMP